MNSFDEPRNRSLLAVVVVLIAVLAIGYAGKSIFGGLFDDSSASTTILSTDTVGVPVNLTIPSGGIGSDHWFAARRS